MCELARLGSLTRCLADGLDELDQLIQSVSVLPRQSDQLSGARYDDCALRARTYRDPTATAEFDQALGTDNAERPQHGVRVNAKHGCQIARRREPFARSGLAFGDGTAQLRRHLVVELSSVVSIDLDT